MNSRTSKVMNKIKHNALSSFFKYRLLILIEVIRYHIYFDSNIDIIQNISLFEVYYKIVPLKSFAVCDLIKTPTNRYMHGNNYLLWSIKSF